MDKKAQTKLIGILNNSNFYSFNSSINSFVLNILTLDWFLNASSSDQIGHLLNANDKAKYESSSVESECGDILFASDKNSLYTLSEKDSIFSSSKEKRNLNASSFTLPNFFILSSLPSNSRNANSGDIKLQPRLGSSSISLLLSELDLKNENKILASTISVLGSGDIFDYECLLAALSLISVPHFNANSSVILLSFNNSSATLNINLSESFSLSVFSNSEFISSLLSSLTPDSISSGIEIFNSAISLYEKINYLKVSKLER